MFTPQQTDYMRNEWCVQLLEATSSAAALARVQQEIRDNIPVYSVMPAQQAQPRDIIRACARTGCQQRFEDRHGDAKWCSHACRQRAYIARIRAA